MIDFEDRTGQYRVTWRRCHRCGRWWAQENDRVGTCPVCAGRKIVETEAALDAAVRSNRSLRGAIKRMKVRGRG